VRLDIFLHVKQNVLEMRDAKKGFCWTDLIGMSNDA
jgi:hypothetical protein